LYFQWGEWHTYPDTGLLSDTTKDKVVGWFDAAFRKTRLQVRIPVESALNAGMGLHDDSFAFSTLDGVANGGIEVDWFFWPQVKAVGKENFWKKAVVRGLPSLSFRLKARLTRSFFMFTDGW